jgi:putative DNA primase/helicase
VLIEEKQRQILQRMREIDAQAPAPNGNDHICLEDDIEIKRLAKLPLVQYERERTAAAKRLGMRASIIDRIVSAERPREDEKQGRAIELPEPAPSEDEVDGEELLDDLSAVIRKYVVMSEAAADACTLWCVHTYLIDAAWISPRLALTSPEKGCGKTTLLDVLARLVWRPLPAANATSSALFRVVEMQRPTLLIDEADTFLGENEELRGILNSGHRRGGSVLRTVSDEHEPRQFSTYSACAIAMIGKLPATLADRSIPIDLKRRREDEPIAAFRWDKADALDALARRVSRWARDNLVYVRNADPEMPPGMHNRAADNWLQLLAIADAAGSRWATRARATAQTLFALHGDDESVRALLLSDVFDVFAARSVDFIRSADLVSALVAIEGRPWAEWKSGKALTANGLARLMAPFAVRPSPDPSGDARGYRLAQLDDAFQRFLRPMGESNRQTVRNADAPGLFDNSEPSESVPF